MFVAGRMSSGATPASRGARRRVASPQSDAHTSDAHGTAQRTASQSTFRTVALVVSAVATILYLHCVAAGVWHVGYEQDFGSRSHLAEGSLVGTEVWLGEAAGFTLP